MQAQCKIEFSHFSADTLHAAISGTWEIDSKSPGPGEVLNRLASDPGIKNIVLKFEEDIGRVVAENLTNLLSTDKVLTYPAIGAIETDYRIEMGISMFEGRLGESAEIIARWAIFDIQGKNVKSITSTRIIEPVQGTGYADMVAAQSRILASLSRELADAIIQLPGN